MGRLENFETKNFIEQVSCLDSLVQQKEAGSIPELIGLIEKISKFEAIWLVLRDSLKSLLSLSEEHTVGQIFSGNSEIQKLCIEIAGQNGMTSAVGPLQAVARWASEGRDYVVLFDALNALSQIGLEESADIFREFMGHEDSVVSAKCIEVLGEMNDSASFDRLCSLIDGAESELGSGLCDLPAASAIRALGRFPGRDAIEFFVSRLHHPNPGVRRLIHNELVSRGIDALDALGRVFQGEDVDSKIFAANILGLMGNKEVTDVLVKALEKGKDLHSNVRYAVYEAIGRTPGMAGLVALVDGLKETDQMVLAAVVSSLDMHLNQWILEQVTGMVKEDSEHGRMLNKAIIASCALDLFAGLYQADEAAGARLMEEIRRSGDGEFIARYREKLAGMESSKARKDAENLELISTETEGRNILAVDDSKAMLNFYRSVAASLGLNITTAMNGREALDTLERDDSFSLIISDMNMPVMDGIEFTRQVRSNPLLPDMPIIMITTESERSQVELALRAGATHFMHKPFSAEKLQDQIRACLGM